MARPDWSTLVRVSQLAGRGEAISKALIEGKNTRKFWSAVDVKNCSDSIAPLLSKIYQASIDSAYLTRDWRTANIIPTFKKGDRQNPAN